MSTTRLLLAGGEEHDFVMRDGQLFVRSCGQPDMPIRWSRGAEHFLLVAQAKYGFHPVFGPDGQPGFDLPNGVYMVGLKPFRQSNGDLSLQVEPDRRIASRT
ncbi:MAG: hypothetical protein L0Y72_15320 [Gemmataceae bacterium]|nr:hypothetical protein [Gemmataceae bacterium]MCI0740415.1 hypothetical protein [Gemmataceae bacterium]